jgi:hypothetical protein
MGPSSSLYQSSHGDFDSAPPWFQHHAQTVIDKKQMILMMMMVEIVEMFRIIIEYIVA